MRLTTCRFVLSAIAMTAATRSPVLLQAGEPLTIENSVCAVEYDSAKGEFSIRHKPSGRVFVENGVFEERDGTAAVKPATHPKFGQGRAIEFVYPNGDRNMVALYPELPLAVFQSTWHNGDAEPRILNKVSVFSAAAQTGAALDDVKTLGTGGLQAPAANPGSYAFLAIADPATRAGVVGGWLTHDRGSGVVFSPVVDDTVRMKAQVDYGRLRIKPGEDAAGEQFAVGYFDDARFGLEAYADAVAKVYAVKLPRRPAGYCTWYMEKHAGSCDEVHLAELAEYAAKNLKPYGFEFVQIDDGWQAGIGGNGPCKNFTMHRPDGRYPGGMKATADHIKRLGLTPGIWFMPFAGTANDPYFKDHQDWFVKDAKGQPYEVRWGGMCLDMTQAGARAHVRDTVDRIARDWGYTFFKLDGFWTGSATKLTYVNNGYVEDGIGDATFADPDKTNIEALRDGARLVREAAGPDVFLLGCCVSQNMRSFGGTFGLLDAMRVGPDTGAGHIGAPHASRLWFLNGRVWWNDPDCVSVRASTPLDQARVNASFTAIADALFYSSDWMPDLPPERLDILRRCMPAHELPSRPVDVLEDEPARIWHLPDTRAGRRRDIVALFNWDKQPATISCATDRIGLPKAKEYVAFDFWANKFVAPFRDVLKADLPGNSCRVLAVRPVADHPQLLSTSRHITQGIVDVTDEKWDAGKSVLSGVSKVVEEDPYELRIVVPVGEASWRVAALSVSPEDEAAGVKVDVRQEGPKIRATLSSASGREVRWSVRFTPGEVQAAVPPAVTQLEAGNSQRGVTLSWAPDGAEGYRIERNDGVIFETAANSITDSSVTIGATYRYRVTSLGWTGIASPAAVVEVTHEALKAPPMPPAPTLQLGDLTPLQVRNGWGKAGTDKSIQGNPLRIDGKTYQRGIGAHAQSLWVYAVPAGAKRFVAVVGIDDEVKNDPRASVVFQVFGDVKEIGETPVLIGESPALCDHTLRYWALDLELDTRFKELRLVVGDAGDGIAADHADWANAGFVVVK